MGVKPPVAAAALAGALVLMWMQRLDVAYFASPKEPITLGVEGAYRFEEARSNRYAQVRGVPTARGAYGLEGDRTFVVVGLRDTPLLVKRPTLPTERWTPGGAAPQPDQRPFSVRGRLLAREDAETYADGFAKFEQMGEVKPRWILVEGERPGADFKTAAWGGGLAAFAAVNLWLLVRGLLASWDRLRRLKADKPERIG